jgi:hypothetical protein
MKLARVVVCLSFVLSISTAALAYGGDVAVQSLGSATFTSPGSANDLHVSLSTGVQTFQQEIFANSLADAARQHWDLSGGSVEEGDAVQLTWMTQGTGWQIPYVQSYYWTQDGTQTGATQQLPYFAWTAPFLFTPGALTFTNPTSSEIAYDNLQLVVDGTPLPDPLSGTLGPAGSGLDHYAFSGFNPVTYYLYTVNYNVADGPSGQLIGVALATSVPEPATYAVVGGGLLLICGLARCRSRRGRS